MPETPDLFSIVDSYIDELFAGDDEILKSAIGEAKKAGLPAIQVSAGQGKFIYLLARMIGAKRILEIGTLGGYSTIWLARSLPKDGHIVTLEAEEKHARAAVHNIAMAGFGKQVEVVVGSAVETLPGVIDRAGGPFDLVFLDADKINYPNSVCPVNERRSYPTEFSIVRLAPPQDNALLQSFFLLLMDVRNYKGCLTSKTMGFTSS